MPAGTQNALVVFEERNRWTLWAGLCVPLSGAVVVDKEVERTYGRTGEVRHWLLRQVASWVVRGYYFFTVPLIFSASAPFYSCLVIMVD